MNEAKMQEAGFTKELELFKRGRCTLCAKKVFKSELRNEIEVNEYNISDVGHCCQQYYFNADGTVKK